MPDGVAMLEPGSGRRVFVNARDREDFEKRGYELAEREAADEAAKTTAPATDEAPAEAPEGAEFLPEADSGEDDVERVPAEEADAPEEAPRPKGGVTTPRRASRDRTV